MHSVSSASAVSVPSAAVSVAPAVSASAATSVAPAVSGSAAASVETASGAPTAPSAPSALASADEAPRWFVLRAYKNEKKAEEVLSGDGGLPYFIPKQYAVRVYHGKKTRRLVPVIPGLVFVHASRTSICELKKQHNFLQFVMKTRHAADRNNGNNGNKATSSNADRNAATSRNTAAANNRSNAATSNVSNRRNADQDYLVVPDKQMADFMQVAGQYEENVTYYSPEELHLEKGMRVRILGGPFDGVEGVFLKVQGARARRLVVQIPNMLAAVVSVEPDLVEVLKA